MESGTELIVVRHGETAWNADRRMQGHVDVPLSEVGRQQYAGTGIGLATVRKVIDNHYGTVTVESQPGAGTTFRVYLPMTDNVVGGE